MGLPLLSGCTEAEPPWFVGALPLSACAEAAEGVGCGAIEVPQIHGDPNSGKLTLRVFARGMPLQPGRPPIVYLTGGPGGSVASLAASGMLDYYANALGRDVVLLEQRGDALSDPPLVCEPSNPPDDTATLQACVSTYRSRGIRLEAFNTIESAHDIEDLRRAIGVEKIFVWGVSYGSLLAGAFAREHPDSTAGIVLESSVLGDRPYRAIENQRLALPKMQAFTKWLGESCARSPRCTDAYPGFDPTAELDEMAARTSVAPVTITKGLVVDSPQALSNLVFRSMYNVWSAMLFARAVWASNHDAVDTLEAETIDGRSVLSDLVDLFASFPAQAPFTIINCYDLTKSWTDEGLAASLQGFDEATLAALESWIEASKAECSALPPPPVDQARFSAPVSSNAPTLLFAGRLDPVTPIEWATADQRRFPHSQMVVSECMAHGVVFEDLDCNTSILKMFVDDPEAVERMSIPSCVAARCQPAALDQQDFFPQ